MFKFKINKKETNIGKKLGKKVLPCTVNCYQKPSRSFQNRDVCIDFDLTSWHAISSFCLSDWGSEEWYNLHQ